MCLKLLCGAKLTHLLIAVLAPASAVKRCPGLPDLPAAAHLLSGGWLAAGANETLGFSIMLNCSTNNTEGGGYTATCQNTVNQTGSWVVTGDGCRRKWRFCSHVLPPVFGLGAGLNSALEVSLDSAAA